MTHWKAEQIQTLAQADSVEHNSRFQQWISKAKGWKDGELTFPNLGEVAGNLFAKDSKKSE